MTDAAIIQEAPFELWRLPKVAAKTGLSTRTIWRMCAADTFPEPRRIGAVAVAWRSTEVIEWMVSLPVAKSTDVAERAIRAR
jgi:predicted DNA-binding transcriptional regulator AlpA